MSHRWNCPERLEAEREGERAQEWGRSRSSNPYDDHYRMSHEQACPEAAEAWRDGYRHAEMREEERREEEASARRAAMRRAELQAEEDYFYSQQQSYEPEPFPGAGEG